MRLSNKKIVMISIVVIIIGISAFFVGSLTKGTVYNQIGKALHKLEPDFSKILHVHMDRHRALVFFTTIRSELGVATLRETSRGFKINAYLGKDQLDIENQLSWYGKESQSENVHLLYGIVNNPKISQVVLLSEENQAATIIKDTSFTMWYAVMDDGLNSPITIRGFNEEGEKIYETGDPEFWNKP
ncbi:hypothetical protein V4V36_01210 [Paenibacillus lautus]|uniref:hypothetical protein n=1 Tax=Paenibacillus lautus TaxID=1401 RepID=UPI0010F38E82|nr:Uncharacterised protein [Actinobacillus pleuropneumoniae]